MSDKSIKVGGKSFSSKNEAAKYFGVRYGNIHRRLRAGWTLEQAFELKPRPKRASNNATQIETKKGIFPSIRAASEAYGIDERTLAKRLRDGWSISEAVGDTERKLRQPSRGIKVTCNGTVYQSIWALADAYKVNRIRTRKRIERGWTPEQAVDLAPSPPRFRNQDGSARDHAWTGKIVTTKGETVPVSAIGKYSVYLISDKKKKREYVGITTGNLKSRLRGHWNMVGKGRHSKLYNAMRKAKAEGRKKDFQIKLIRDDAKNFEELQLQEQDEINKRNTIKKGFNTAAGGSLGTPHPIKVAGETFVSQTAAAEYYGVEPHNFNQRITKLGWTPEQAAGLDDSKVYGTAIEVNGVSYSSISSACSHLKKNYKTIMARIHNHGWSIDQAFDLVPRPKPKKPSNSIQLKTSIGKFGSIGEAAAATGLKQATIANRIRSGWNHNQALGAEPPPKKKRLGNKVEINGKTYSSLSEAARSYGVTPKIAHQRIKRGSTLKEALGIEP